MAMKYISKILLTLLASALSSTAAYASYNLYISAAPNAPALPAGIPLIQAIDSPQLPIEYAMPVPVYLPLSENGGELAAVNDNSKSVDNTVYVFASGALTFTQIYQNGSTQVDIGFMPQGGNPNVFQVTCMPNTPGNILLEYVGAATAPQSLNMSCPANN
jgi:hypothetical protein